MDNLLSFAFATANFRRRNDRAPRLSLNLEEFPRSPVTARSLTSSFFVFISASFSYYFRNGFRPPPSVQFLPPSSPLSLSLSPFTYSTTSRGEPSYKRNKIAVALVTRNVTKLRNDSLVHGCKCNNNLAGTNQLLRSLPIYLRCFLHRRGLFRDFEAA